MKILLVSPAPARTRHGNRVTALRWARCLRSLGHQVRIASRYEGDRADLLVALHARKSASSVAGFRRDFPETPVIVALTGTDVYRDIHRDPRARAILGQAWRIVILQPLARAELPRRLRWRARVVYQSAAPPRRTRRPTGRTFDVCVIGHLRREKDPLRTAMAARHVPESSRIRVLHAGKAMSSRMGRHARRETARNPRYRWLGDLPAGEARALLARSRVMVLSSRLEGGANVVSEALAARVPILASRIAGSVGLLGSDYPGFFPVGDTRRLAALLSRVETDAPFLARLARACARRAWITSPHREKESWRRLLAELPRRARPSTKSKTPGRKQGLLAQEAPGWG